MSVVFQSKRAVSFIKKQDKSKPFMMMLSTPACHNPFTPAPQYNSTFEDIKAPRNGSFNAFFEVRNSNCDFTTASKAMQPKRIQCCEYRKDFFA